MDQNKTALERTFELAQSGRFSSFGEIKKAVRSEGYAVDQLTGPQLSKQVRGLIEAAKNRQQAAR
ncbi:hypothetical protein [Devosia sp.]|uniref:hypothetical protein n=1 Tax=Devosia sp. TaxID=1871048 RepID=UPI002FC6BAAF